MKKGKVAVLQALHTRQALARECDRLEEENKSLQRAINQWRLAIADMERDKLRITASVRNIITMLEVHRLEDGAEAIALKVRLPVSREKYGFIPIEDVAEYIRHEFVRFMNEKYPQLFNSRMLAHR